MGAKKVLLCFSAASMMIQNTNWAVRPASMKTPWAKLVFPLKLVVTAKGPGKRAATTPADAMAPIICAMKTKQPLASGTAPMRQSPKVTCFEINVGFLPLFSVTYSRIEQATRYSVEDPCIDGQREAKSKTDIEKL
jgi:hypothetical protein